MYDRCLIILSLFANKPSSLLYYNVVVKIFGHKRKPEGGKRIGAVQRRHIKGIGRLA